MVEDLSVRVTAANAYMRNRLGKTITYKRWKENVYNPDTGTVKAWWESPVFKATVLSVGISEISAAGGRLKTGDCNFTFPVSEFTTQAGTNNQGESDHTEPTPGDEIVYDGDTWKVDLATGASVWKRDATGTLFQVYARRLG